MSKKYTDEFLISELQRFHRENGRVPTSRDMTPKSGYPTFGTYQYYFGAWNNALEAADLDKNQIHHIETLDGTETCSYCGRRSDEIPHFISWIYHNNVRYCHKHGYNGKGIPDYVTGNLDINSPTGLGRAGEILVAKTLEIADEYDCNRISCGFKIDLYHDEYGKIDVKTSSLNYEYNNWGFGFFAKKDADTYICIGLSYGNKYVQHVWIIPNINDVKNKIGLNIKDTSRSLSNREHWEVLSKPYDDVWQEMIIGYRNGNCKVFK